MTPPFPPDLPRRRGLVARLHARLERLAAERPVFLAFCVFLGAALVVVPLSIPYYLSDGADFLQNIAAEAHGMVFDLLVIGWFMFWLNRLAERRLRTNRYLEEIDDYLGWHSPEATHRIAGNVRRLNRNGIRRGLKLTEAYLKGANLAGASLDDADLWGATLRSANLHGARLNEANLAGADLQQADLERAVLERADLRGANLTEADLERAFLERADLRGAILTGADLQFASLPNARLARARFVGANLRGAHLEGADLTGADFSGATLHSASLDGALLDGASFANADLERADLTGIVVADASALATLFEGVRSVQGVKLDAETRRTLREAAPHLFPRPARV
jgi:uncharacterized protein YjbI with pentapeptide repeats